MNIFLGDYTSLTPGSSHETYKCINTTIDNYNFDLICLEELTSCPEVNAFMVNQDNKTYASVIMEAKKVQIVSTASSESIAVLGVAVILLFLLAILSISLYNKKIML